MPASKKRINYSPQDAALNSLYGTKGNSAGNALINKFLSPGTLGRVETSAENGNFKAGQDAALQRANALLKNAGNSDASKEALANMKSGLGGYTSPQYQASREQLLRGEQSNYATAASQLAKAQARGKVYGAAGAAQQANLLMSSERNKNNLEQDLMVKNIDEQNRRNAEYGQYSSLLNQQAFAQNQAATGDYNKTAADLRNEELERQKINIGQANAETASQIGLYTGAGATNLATEAAKEAAKIQKQAIRNINGGGKTTVRK